MSTNQEILRTSYSRSGFTINWGAIFAGLVLILAAGWLLFALSSAVGLSLIDIDQLQSRDLKNNTGTIGAAAASWIIITAIITYFLGGFLSGAVSGRLNRPTGTLHGVVLWACTIIIGMIFGAIGVSSVVTTATGAAKAVASSGFNAAAIVASQNAVDGKNQLSTDSFLHPLTGYLKRGIAKAISQTETERETSNKETKQGTNNPSSSTHQSAIGKESIRDSSHFPATGHPSSSSHNIEVSAEESKSDLQRVERIIDRTDPQVFVSAAVALVQGNEEQAKEIISSHLDIDEAKLNKVIQNVKTKAEAVAEDMKDKAEKAKEYATGALWVVLIGYLAGLLACIGGARLGTQLKDEAVLENDNRTIVRQ